MKEEHKDINWKKVFKSDCINTKYFALVRWRHQVVRKVTAYFTKVTVSKASSLLSLKNKQKNILSNI